MKTKKVLAKPYTASKEAQEVLNIEPIDVTRVHPDANIPVYRYRLKITKKGLLKYFSHLDWQNTFHKVLARTGLRMAYTLGFNPTMKVSMGIALPLFAESEGELVDIEILDKLTEQEVMDVINFIFVRFHSIMIFNIIQFFIKRPRPGQIFRIQRNRKVSFYSLK